MDARIKKRIVEHALTSIKDNAIPLEKALEFASAMYPGNIINTEKLVDHLVKAAIGDPVRLTVHQFFNFWDHVPSAEWADTTLPNSVERRQRVYQKLGLSDSQQRSFGDLFKIYIADHPTVIAERHRIWYQGERAQGGFFWKAYRHYLENQAGWNNDALLSLDETTSAVIERLSDPTQAEAYQSKGLVVGYVQSGKTANFTGVVARASDAGYRLVIVLTGTTEILRKQTQRRLDKEMIGLEFLGNDYAGDKEIGEFLRHEVEPSLHGGYEWQRLTGPEYDYKSLKRGIGALTFAKYDNSKPIYDSVNLYRSTARLIVVKKNAAILRNILRDLKRIRTRLEEIPALVIDDESDQASLNTVDPSKESGRSTINGLIVKLLETLPRSQYVGYTATPFANVFVDPENSKDLFPKDFLLALPRPPEYMGVADFYDIDAVAPTDERPNKHAFVRSVVGDDYLDEGNLVKAVDSFVLSGAIKLYRDAHGVRVRKLQHHTMLVHLSSKKNDHKEDRERIDKLFSGTNYRSDRRILDRLRLLYQEDFLPITEQRAPGLPRPRFEELGMHLGATLQRVRDGGQPVVVVNSDKDSAKLDFDSQSVWKIIVGGTKLSRGFTVEGLTVSYYRRRTNTADTLMQMGRWFGYRQGYADLVRLFIGTKEVVNKKGETIDLYEAFGAACRDEEAFREELKRYASIDEARVLPRDIPPLVASHLLRPTAKNKMYNAKIVHRNFGGEWVEVTLAPAEEKAVGRNWARFQHLTEGLMWSLSRASVPTGGGTNRFQMAACRPTAQKMVEFLRGYEWLGKPGRMAEVLEFLDGKGEIDPRIDRWLVLAPQMAGWQPIEKLQPEMFSTFSRTRVGEDGRFKAYSESRHRAVAESVSLGSPKDASRSPVVIEPDDVLTASKQAVMLFYKVESDVGAKGPHAAFALLFPRNGIRTPIRFGVVDPRKPPGAVIDPV